MLLLPTINYTKIKRIRTHLMNHLKEADKNRQFMHNSDNFDHSIRYIGDKYIAKKKKNERDGGIL